MDTLELYLKHHRCKIFKNKEALDVYRLHKETNKKTVEEMCGSIIFDTLDGVFENEDEENVIKLLIVNKEEKPISVFYGTIEGNQLSSDYTCSTELPNGGALLRFYALFLANKENGKIQSVTGGISGGIPPLSSDDSEAEVDAKKTKLRNYHFSRGATIDGDTFQYTISYVVTKIPEMFRVRGGKRHTKTRKTRKITARGKKIITMLS
jgi:hypothetical protein